MRSVPSEEQVHLLAFLDSINKRFDNSSLEKRIEMQKLVYLGRECGLNLDYRFGWHFHGPYSSNLADVGYAIEKSDYSRLATRAKIYPKNKLSTEQNNIERFKQAVEPHNNDVVWLEIAGSLVWVRQRYYPDVPIERCRDSLIRDVAYVYKKFEPCQVMEVLDRLEKFDVIE